MDDSFIVSAYCIISDTLEQLGQQTHKLAQLKDAEILTVAVVAAKYFRNHQEPTFRQCRVRFAVFCLGGNFK
jgi:hypothetical protein